MSTGFRPRYDSPNQTRRRLKTYTSAQASIDKKISHPQKIYPNQVQL